jgi:hypothetical protein
MAAQPFKVGVAAWIEMETENREIIIKLDFMILPPHR